MRRLESTAVVSSISPKPLMNQRRFVWGEKARRPVARTCRRQVSTCASALQMFQSDDIELERRVGSVGIMSISSYEPPVGGLDAGMDNLSVQTLGGQEAREDGITATLWSGWIRRGSLSGARVLLKAYPAMSASVLDGLSADTLAANELAAHAALQPPAVAAECPQVSKLLGGFVSGLGGTVTEQWLVFRNSGLVSAEQYALKAADAGAEGKALGEGEFWDRFDSQRPLQRRKVFVLKCLREMLTGLAFMHSKNWLHQSLGPNSLLLSTAQERDAYTLQGQIRDLAFAVNVSDEALFGGATLAEVWERGSIGANADPKQSMAESLWQRARSQGAWSEEERRNFGIADDIYAAGLLLAFLAFVPFCEPGSCDGPTIQRIFETTFKDDVDGARDFCDADERWQEAVAFMDGGECLGWDLLKAMLQPDWRLRPTAESCLNHPFLKGKGLEGR